MSKFQLFNLVLNIPSTRMKIILLNIFAIVLLAAFAESVKQNILSYFSNFNYLLSRGASKCPKNEVYKDCGSSHQEACDSEEDIIVGQVCVKGCFCNNGFVRKSENGRNQPCIRKPACPKKTG